MGPQLQRMGRLLPSRGANLGSTGGGSAEQVDPLKGGPQRGALGCLPSCPLCRLSLGCMVGGGKRSGVAEGLAQGRQGRGALGLRLWPLALSCSPSYKLSASTGDVATVGCVPVWPQAPLPLGISMHCLPSHPSCTTEAGRWLEGAGCCELFFQISKSPEKILHVPP